VALRLEPSRKKFLAGRNRAAIALQPELRLLRRRLLAIGGEEVVLYPTTYVEEFLARAQIWRSVTPRKVRGRPNDCHANAAAAYAKASARSKCRIVTGWALHAHDVVWRRHSWILRGDELCETTLPAKIYAGVILDPTESAAFIEAQIGPGDR